MNQRGKKKLITDSEAINTYCCNDRTKKLLNFTSNINNISSEIKALQRSIAIMKQDFPKILRAELVRLKGNEY